MPVAAAASGAHRHLVPRANSAPLLGSRLMGKRRADADGRRFFDEFECVGVSRLRATGVIDPAKRQAVIPFPNGKQKLIGTAHTRLKNDGGWSYFICPGCSGRSKKLWLVGDAPRCRLCLDTLGVLYRSAYAFGRSQRLQERDHRIDRLQAMLEGGPLRLKPAPANRRLDRRNRLTAALQRSRVVTRLAQIAYQQHQSSDPHEPLPLLRAYKSRAAAIEVIPDLKSLWRAKSNEDLERGLDAAQSAVFDALQSNDQRMRMSAAKLMLRARQARQLGWR